MPFVFDWATLGTANGSTGLTDGTKTSTLTANSEPGVFYSNFLSGNLFVQSNPGPVESEVSFSTPIKNATFEILDVDSNESTFDDRVTVLAFDINGNPVPVIFSNLSPFHVQTGNTVEANGAVSTAVEGEGAPDSLTVSFGGPVATIRVIFEGGLSSGANTGVVGFGDISGDIVCFGCGTQILTDRGQVAVEELQVDDLVQTLDHGFQPVRWIGSRSVKGEGRFAPIRIAKGHLGNDRDLVLSPQHRVLLSGWRAELHFGEGEILVAAIHLLNDCSVRQEFMEEVEYFHILFDQHEIVVAEGAYCESFHPGKVGLEGMNEDQYQEIISLFPDLTGDLESYGPSARASLRSFEGQLAV